MAEKKAKTAEKGGAVVKHSCPKCGSEMNYHAEKLDHLAAATSPEDIDPEFGGVVSEMHFCPRCGYSASRRRTS